MTASWGKGRVAAQIPTKDNPIAGRIAFWTDDETCKVNINTAGGFSTKDLNKIKTLPAATLEASYAGSFWDTPRVNTQFDRQKRVKSNTDTDPGGLKVGGLGLCQPPRNEFQRYPGHPSTTSLGIVFQKLLTSEQLYLLAPFVLIPEAREAAPTGFSRSMTIRWRQSTVVFTARWTSSSIPLQTAIRILIRRNLNRRPR